MSAIDEATKGSAYVIAALEAQVAEQAQEIKRQARLYVVALRYTCPHCGTPAAHTVESDVDIHPGAGYTCDQCRGRVVFVAMTTGEYCAWANNFEA